MKEKIKLRLEKFKKFLRRNMTPAWFKRSLYQVMSFLVCVALLIGVAAYAVTKSYDERELEFVDGFTITAHTGAFDTAANSLEFIEAAIKNNVEVIEIDIRQRPNGEIVMSHDLVVTNNDGVLAEEAFKLLSGTEIEINLDIKETRTLNTLHDLLVEYNLLSNAFLTGIEESDVKAVKASSCANMKYYLNYEPSILHIYGDDYQQELLDLLAETGAVGINCNYKYATGTLESLLHENGYLLSIWTVNNTYTIKRALALSPDNVTTEEYEKVLETINEWGE